MRLLLDTQAAIWSVSASKRISGRVQEIILQAEDVFVSVCSVWEIAIKYRLGRPDAPPFSGASGHAKFLASGFRILDIRAEHAVGVEELQFDHDDPFDRLILAQAVVEPLRLVTSDRKLAAYSDTIISL